MVSLPISFAVVTFALTSQVSAHISIWHPSMYGFNLSAQAWPNGTAIDRPQDPLYNRTFDEWWFHGHIGSPPHPDDIKQMPVGQSVMFETTCDKGDTSYWQSNPGGDGRDPNDPNKDYPCVGAPTSQFHTNGVDDLGGCALSIAYKSDINEVQPEDLVVFSVQQECVWHRFTYFDIPAEMPPCPNGKCICAWHWMHRSDSGSEQMYMVGFQCNTQNATGTRPLARPKVPYRCGHDPLHPELTNLPSCQPGPKQPFYWQQAERNNIFNEYEDPPLHLDWYGFFNGAQNDIFEGDPVSRSLPMTPPSTKPADPPAKTPTLSPGQYHHHHHHHHHHQNTSEVTCGAQHDSQPSPRDDYDEVYAREEPEIVNRGWSRHRRLSHNHNRHT